MANTRVTELDFDQIKDNLKEYLKNQSAFTDFDFDASNLSVLLDILAYNTHYNAVLANMMSNEMFLDTALKRSSVASLAKHLRYTPRSIRSSVSKLRVTVGNVPGNPTFLSIVPFTLFNTSVDGTALTFYNRNTYTTTPNGFGDYVFEEVEVYQGRKLDFFYTVPANATPATRYKIPNAGVDTTTIRVKVTSTGGDISTYTRMDDVTAAKSNSLIYYLEENTDGLYEIYFGDGVLGYSPTAGSVISIEYLISDGTAGNVSNNIAISWNTNTIAGESDEDRSIETISKPSGGQNGEPTDQVRFNAVQRYTTNGRAVTVNDYSSLISSELPGAQSVNVWGGEYNDPPVFGRVFISIKPRTGYVLTEFEKTRIIDTILKPRSLVTVVHEFVDPSYTFLSFEVDLTFNESLTNASASQLAAQARSVITTYLDTNLERFNAVFYPSALQQSIMDIDDAIVAANLLVSVQKRLAVPAGGRFSGEFTLPIKPHPGEITSNFFVVNNTDGTVATVFIRDVPNTMPPDYNGTGILKLVDAITGNIVNNALGTVNYATGVMAITNLGVVGYIGASSDVRIRAEIQEGSRNIVPGYNEILTEDDTVTDVISNLRNGVHITVGTTTR
jgi:hypothetical protein